MSAALHWELIAVLGTGEGLVAGGFAARCGHRHASQDEAVACPWTPDPWPEVCDLLAREVRTPELDVNPRTGIARAGGEQGRLL